MNWITNFVRPKINSFLGRREMPENLWIKDPETGEMVFHTELPVCVGFGVKTAEQARAIGASADGVVVGTAIVNAVANVIGADGKLVADPAEAVATLVDGLAHGVRRARLAPA